jgi:hypothetical protein
MEDETRLDSYMYLNIFLFVFEMKCLLICFRASAFRSLSIIYHRRRREVFRKAFSQWFVSVRATAHMQQQRDIITRNCVTATTKTRAKYRSFVAWRSAHIRQKAVHALIRKLSIHDRKRVLRSALQAWRCEVRHGDEIKVIKTCVRTLVRHGTIADCFKTWKHHYCTIYYPRKVMIAKSIWRRCGRMRIQYLRASFFVWKSHLQRDQNQQLRVGLMVKSLRKHACRMAIRLWSDAIAAMKTKQALLLKVFGEYSKKSLHITKCMSFSRWQQYSILVERHRHAEVLRETETHLQITAENHSSITTSLMASHARDTRTTLQCVRLVMKMMKLLSCRHHRLHRLMIAFRRWSYLNVVENSCKSTEVVCYTHRIVMLMFARLKERRMTAFTKWKTVVRNFNIQKRVILQLLYAHHKSDVLAAFRKWREFRYEHHVNTLSTQMKHDRVKACINAWQYFRVHIPFRKWKETADFLSARLKVVLRMIRILKLYMLRMFFQKWNRRTVVHELLEQKSCLVKYQTNRMKNIEQYLSNSARRCQARQLLRWKTFTNYSRSLNKAVLIRTKLTRQQICKDTFSGWSYVFRRKKKYCGGLQILHTLTSGADVIRLVKYFNHWTRAVAKQTQQECSYALSQLKEKHRECVDALHSSRAQCGDANESITQLTHANSKNQVTMQQDEEYKISFVDYLAYKKQVQAVFYRWKDRFLLFKTNGKTFSYAARHLFARLNVYCLRQRFSLWKFKVKHVQVCTKVFSTLNHKWMRFQIQSAFRRWQHHSLQYYVTQLAERVQLRYSQMDNEVSYYQGEKNNVNTSILFMIKWKAYVSFCLKRKRTLHQSVVSIAKCASLIAFHKWKHNFHCSEILVTAFCRLTKARLFQGFFHWKRTHVKVRKLDGVVRHLHKWHHRTSVSLFATWSAYCRVLKLQRMMLRSVLLTRRKREQAQAQGAFARWENMLRAARIFDHKAASLTRRTKDRDMHGVFTEWHNQCVTRKTYRANREKVVYSVSQSLPVVRDLYKMLYSADSVDESVAMSTLALEKILPGFTVEIFVMVSNTMLRASVPMRSSVHGTSARFSSHLFDKNPQSSPMEIPSSPIYSHQQLRRDLASPPSPSFSQSHILPPSSSGKPTPSPWTAEKDQGGQMLHTPYERRYQPHEERDSAAEIVSVIVGRGNVGVCAKTGSYHVHRNVTSSSHSPEKHKQSSLSFDHNNTADSSSGSSSGTDISSIVIPLISSGCIVGVLQLTPNPPSHRVVPPNSSAGGITRPDSPVSCPYPSTTTAATSFSYPFPNPPPHQPSFGSYSLPGETLSLSTHQGSRFLKTATTPLPPPQFTELVNMCMDVHISDINTISQLCIVVGTLSDTLRMFIDGNIKKTDFMTAALAEKEQLELYISQLHGEVATFEESVDKSSKRIDHLEKSRLKYFNECKAFKEKAESFEKNCEGLTETLTVYKEKLEKYEDKKRSEGVVMEKLHQSLTKATIEVFGTPATAVRGGVNDDSGPVSYSAGDGGRVGGGGGGGGGGESYLHTNNTSDYDASGSKMHLSHIQAPNRSSSALHMRNLEGDTSYQSNNAPDIRINTSTPSSRPVYPQAPNTMNTLTTFDTSSRFSPPHPSVPGTGISSSREGHQYPQQLYH